MYSFSISLFSGTSPQPIVYGRISCSGAEQTLSACSKNVYYYNNCPINRIGGVICEGNFYFSVSIKFLSAIVPTNCTSGDVRLVNGSSDSEGIVEVCYQGVWTTVSGYEWDYRDARVLCRQLGYHDKCEQNYDNSCDNKFILLQGLLQLDYQISIRHLCTDTTVEEMKHHFSHVQRV